MSTAIKATCPTCGDVDLTPKGLHMTVYDTGTNGIYSFFCPKCYEQCDKPLDLQIVKLLRSAGVGHTMIHVPLEFKERKPSDEELTFDNLMDLHVELGKTDFVAALAFPEPPMQNAKRKAA